MAESKEREPGQQGSGECCAGDAACPCGKSRTHKGTRPTTVIVPNRCRSGQVGNSNSRHNTCTFGHGGRGRRTLAVAGEGGRDGKAENLKLGVNEAAAVALHELHAEASAGAEAGRPHLAAALTAQAAQPDLPGLPFLFCLKTVQGKKKNIV